jgi:hypothetical protein
MAVLLAHALASRGSGSGGIGGPSTAHLLMPHVVPSVVMHVGKLSRQFLGHNVQRTEQAANLRACMQGIGQALAGYPNSTGLPSTAGLMLAHTC